MSLGVLNNLSAVYAENNLNNTNNSLNTVLQQLSSGSKINSGADDAAGLSLVDGLQANQQALTQSVTNATEGVGLLQVADGALSQVTSLLNRAVTLATEASNGTLNSSQDTAANQEYQSILSEISNIGSTTTYNDTAVFGTNTNIYTGDSSTAGSSIDALNIRSLSSSNVGDSGGAMAYSNGQNNVFLNLSGSTNAQATDSLNASGNTSIVANYLVKGANGTETAAVATISVGGTSGYENTANGLISAINNAGLGLTASFTTAAQAGVAGGTTQTGIQITGGLVSVGADPNAVSTSGVINPAGITGEDFNLGQTITVTAGGTTAASFVIGSSTNSLAGLAAAINSGTGAGAQAESVTASVITNGNGSQSIALSDATGGGLLAVNVTGGQGAQSLSNPTTGSPTAATLLQFSNSQTGSAYQAPGSSNPGSQAIATLNLGSGYTATSATVASGTIVLSNGTSANPTVDTFVMGGTTGNGTIAGGTTLGSLATAMSTALGVSASVTSTGITMTANNVGTTIALAGTSALSVAPSVNNFNTVNGMSATVGTAGSTTLSMAGGSGFDYSAPSTYGNNDVLTAGTSLVLSNGTADSPGTATTFVIGGTTSGSVVGVGAASSNSTLSTLLTAIQTVSANNTTGISSATVNTSGQIVLTSSSVGTTISLGSGTNLEDQQAMSVNSGAVNAATVGGPATIAIPVLTSATGNTLAGSVVVGNGEGGAAQTFVMGTGTYSGNGTHAVQGSGPTADTWTVNGDTEADLVLGINAASTTLGLGITATDGNGAGTGVTLTMTNSAPNHGSSISVSNSTLTDNYATSLQGVTASGASGTFGTMAMTSAGAIPAGATLGGSIVLSNTIGGTTTVLDTFVMNSNGGLNSAGGAGDTGNTWDLTTANSNIAGLEAAIKDAGTETGYAGATLDLTAAVDATTGGLKISSLSDADTNLSMAGSAVTTDVAEVGTSGTQGQIAGGQATGYAAGTASSDSTITFGGSGTLTTLDTLASTGNMVIGNGSSTVTFALGSSGTIATSSSGGHTTVTTANSNLNSLMSAINGSTLGVTAAIDSAGTGVQLSTAAFGTSISVAGQGGFTDNYATQITNPTSGEPGVQHESSVLDLTNGGSMNSIGADGKLSGTLILSNDVNGTTVADTFVMNSAGNLNQAGGAGDTGNVWDLSVGNSTLAGLKAAINDAGTETGFAGATLDVNASVDGASGGLFLQGLDTNGLGTDTGLTMTVASNLTLNAAGADTTVVTAGHNAGPANIVIANIGSNNQAGDTVTGNIVVSNTGPAGSNQNTTFTMGGTGGATGYGTQNVNVGGTTLTNLMTAIDNSGLSLSATMNSNGSGLSITSQSAGGTITAASALVDQYTVNSTTTNSGGTAPGQATDAVATLGTGVANLTSNQVTGAVVISNNGVQDTFTMGTSAGSTGVHNFTTGTENLAGLAQAINSATNLGVSASVGNGVLNMLASAADTTIAIGSNSLAATVNENASVSDAPGTPISGANSGSSSTATFTLGGGSLTQLSSTDTLVGSIAITEAGVNGGNAVNFTMGGTVAQIATNSSSQVYVNGNTLSNLEGAMQTALGVGTNYTGGSLVLTTNNLASIAIGSSGSLQDFGTNPTASSATLGTFASESDKVTGTISLDSGSGVHTTSFTNSSIAAAISQIDGSNLGVTASYVVNANAGGYGSLVLTSNTFGTAGNIASYGGTTITDTTPSATVNYVGASAYNTGISNSTSQLTELYDKSSGQTNPYGTVNSNLSSNASAGSGVATISYSDGAGVSLSATDLSNETNAQGALTSLNSAITAVAAQDGYIGAQINTLNSVSQVLSTQQENVEAAQNAVQATDYAAASSNMSKYEILSQTGISALAQANSIQQEVTKLLQ
ncbi:MAG: flagellin [Terracidiphilus sp.]|jgi:flagellin